MRATRERAVEVAAKGAWAGTEPLIGALLDESSGAPAWRPGRAALERALSELEPRVWMRPEEVAAWVNLAKGIAKRRGLSTVEHQLDLEIGATRFSAITSAKTTREKGMKVGKAEALGMAHYALGLDKPTPNGDAAALMAWFSPRFGSAVTRVAGFLDCAPPWLSSRLRGWTVSGGERVDVGPPGYLIRALDWIHRVGPTCPYGEISDQQPFPGGGA